ncbi:MAG: peptidoglycan editing factor PgeF [Pseudomonadota bacterium]
MAVDWIRADWPAPASVVAGTTLRSRDGKALPVAGTPCWLQQVHGSRVVAASAYDDMPEADASVSGDEGYICVVRTADCLPVLLCSRDGLSFAAAHAGWRGLAAGVLENTVATLGVAGSELLAWLGPAISQPSFEVGGEVRAAFVDHDAQAAMFFEPNARGRWQADLYGLARQRLASVGVNDTYGGGLCTVADEKRFFSYRRDADSGRMLSFIATASP